MGKGGFGRPSHDSDYLSLTPPQSGDWIDGRGILDQYLFSGPVASLNEIYTLKVSHSPWVIGGLSNWAKHLRDIRFLRDEGCLLIEPLHQAAYAQWNVRKGEKKVNLNQDANSFFGTSVTRYFDHDSVHRALALGDSPAFESISLAGAQVRSSRELFWNLPDWKKSRLVWEETMVLSLERDLLPGYMVGGEPPTRTDIWKSYRQQLRLLITQYSKGWWPKWIIQNYFEHLSPPLDYWTLFWDSDYPIALPRP
jgi:hypothetical protein